MNYKLVRSKRKTMAIYVQPDAQVLVRAPRWVPRAEIDAFVARKNDWITRSQAEVLAQRFATPEQVRGAGGQAPYAPGEFERAARELVAVWEKRLDVRVTHVSFRRMTSRWGSCTPQTGRIRINTELAHCPRGCLEYIVIHELAHMKAPAHNARFWDIVAGAMPDYLEKQAELKRLQGLLTPS
ncbi:MAG: M48 family metallopeptidase [Clostridiales Family XIII bacterium]|jgi:predicted metal-dependent hydrolase|nr:M48 family metallopeptidase [Clostridiales Family XIII bacterium]